MKGSTIVVWVIVVIIIIVGIIVWMNYSSPASAPTTSTTTVQPVQTSAPVPAQIMALTISTDPTLGMYLVGPTGMTLYTYNKDTTGVSNCTGQCVQSWPAYSVSASSALSGATGVNGVISSITRKDNGAIQVTYNSKPLYYWFKDVVPSDVTGQGVNGFSVAKP